MAKTTESESLVPAELLQPIETLAAAEQTPAYLVAGVKAANGWGQGKELTLAEYRQALEAFLKGPMTGGTHNG